MYTAIVAIAYVHINIPVVRLDVLDSLPVVLEDVDPNHGAVERWVRALYHLVVQVFAKMRHFRRGYMYQVYMYARGGGE